MVDDGSGGVTSGPPLVRRDEDTAAPAASTATVDEDVADELGPGRNMRALTRTLARLQVDPEVDATAAMLVSLAERMDSGKFTAHDAQQYRLGIEALSRATVSVPSSKVDELRARRARRQHASGSGPE